MRRGYKQAKVSCTVSFWFYCANWGWWQWRSRCAFNPETYLCMCISMLCVCCVCVRMYLSGRLPDAFLACITVGRTTRRTLSYDTTAHTFTLHKLFVVLIVWHPQSSLYVCVCVCVCWQTLDNSLHTRTLPRLSVCM